jgi:hypothetical protein
MIKAHNRPITEWFDLIRTGKLTLPRFQRAEAWDHRKVATLANTILDGLPAGATLILNVGDHEPFPSRPLEGAPPRAERVTEQLLDGQQRLTALWKSLHDGYSDRTFLLAIVNADKKSIEPEVYSVSRYKKGNSADLYPLWVNYPEQVWRRGAIPLRLLCPGDISHEITEWLKQAIPGKTAEDYERRDAIKDRLTKLRNEISNFNLPYLDLPVNTAKEVALDVFVKMNTSSVRLSTYDIVVALVEEAAGESLRQMVQRLKEATPHAEAYASVEGLVLDIAALRQDRQPNNAGYGGLNYKLMADEWSTLGSGLKGMTGFLNDLHIYDQSRLPSYPPLPVIAALWEHLPMQPDQLGRAQKLLRRYLWSSFFTTRYDRSTSFNALLDYRALKQAFKDAAQEPAVPIFNQIDYPPAEAAEIQNAGWPKRTGVLDRGLLALSLSCNALDPADSQRVTRENIGKREYHHLFPASLLRDAKVTEGAIFRAVNCALITWRTNRTIAAKDPLIYLRERIDNAGLTEADLEYRLRTHLIPFEQLNVGGYDKLDEVARAAAIQTDYGKFCERRAHLYATAVKMACSGEQFDATTAFQRAAANLINDQTFSK